MENESSPTFSVIKDLALLPEYIIYAVVSSKSSRMSKSSKMLKYDLDGSDALTYLTA
jgi:hypothetical protein